MDDINEKKRILMVDDDEIQLSFLELLLNEEYEVCAAKSGKKALEYIYQGFMPNLILLDILMPEMDGFEVFSRIRAISLLQDLPIVFLSSISETAEIQQALNMGAADYIMKPYNKENLLSRIKNALAVSEYKRSRKLKIL